ncbi:MAG: bifunctional diguanylate cyclase/phosphodiesterase [Methylovulum sp.]|nr:MAG: bifunctional diguanylate cyclase/phosphodiesterase [Methylovulum sp.]
MILISLFFIALINFSYLLACYFYPDLSGQNSVLIFNGLFSIFLVGVYYRKTPGDPVQQETPLPERATVETARYGELDLLDYLPDFLCLKDKDGRWLKASGDYLAGFNLQDVDYIGKTDDELAQYPQSDVRALKLSSIQDKSAWHLGRPVKETRTIADPGKESGLLEITRTPVFDAGQNKSKLVLTGRFAVDGGEKSKWEPLVDALQVCHLNIAFLDADFRIDRVNQAFSQLTGYSGEEIKNKPLSLIIEGEFEPVRKDFFKVGNERFWSGELIGKHKNGQLVPIKLDITEIAKDKQDIAYFATLLDITRQKQSEKRIMQIAHYDDLTGLANRAMFFDRLNRFLSESKRRHLHAVIFYINLDRFKAVNDSLGHSAGNQLLKDVAIRLRLLMGSRDVVARLNGDEFALLILNETGHEQAIYSASMIAGEVLRKVSEMFYIDQRELFITASLGIALYPEDGVSAEMLLKHADIAMYEAKRQGRNNYQFYKQDQADATQDRLLVEFNLRKAIEKNELQLYYQPQYYADSGKIFGAEALIRWLHGANGETKMISPEHFIAIAEESGLIVEIGEWIMRTACLQLKKWLDEDYGLQQVSVNVSARQFTHNEFLKTVENALCDAGLDAGRLELEITESLLVGDIRQIELQLQRLKKMGVRIALDDFGTGYSSLSYLKNLPIDVLKIDRSFVKEMTIASKDAKLVTAMIKMGHSLGQRIIAEGVETEQQLIYLTHLGCDIIQGYYFSPPLPTYQMTALLVSDAQGDAAEGKPVYLFESTPAVSGFL